MIKKNELKITDSKRVKQEDFNDLYEIEKPEVKDVREFQFIDVEKKQSDKKKEIVDFQEIERVYRRRKSGDTPFDFIRMYTPLVITEMWIFTIILLFATVSGLFLFRDWLFGTFGIYGEVIIQSPAEIQNIHTWFGFFLGIAGLIHILIHLYLKNKDILPKQAFKDFKSFLHSGLYLVGFARREDFGVGRFFGRQKITYTALVYILGLTFFTGFLRYTNLISEDLSFVHVVPGGLSFMVLLFHFLITIRKHDFISLNCAFFSGKLPRWYIKKNHPLWYKDIVKYSLRSDTESRYLKSQINEIITSEDNLTKAVLKFVLLFNDSPDMLDFKAFVRNLKSKLDPNNIQRIIELAEELKDEVYEKKNELSTPRPQPSFE